MLCLFSPASFRQSGWNHRWFSSCCSTLHGHRHHYDHHLHPQVTLSTGTHSSLPPSLPRTHPTPQHPSIKSSLIYYIMMINCNRNRKLQTSKAPLKSQAQGTSLLTSAALNQRGFQRIVRGKLRFGCQKVIRPTYLLNPLS